MITVYDRYRNRIAPGCKVMDSETGKVGVIASIHQNGMEQDQARRANCVELKGISGLFKPENLMGLGTLH